VSQTNYFSEHDLRVMWLRDLLPLRVPNARILMFNYLSEYLSENAPKVSLRSIATDLLIAIKENRRNKGSEVGIFLHSSGRTLHIKSLSLTFHLYRIDQLFLLDIALVE